MLKTIGEWEKLSEKERLVILAIALELIQVEGGQAKYMEVQRITGLNPEEFRLTILNLKKQGLLSVDSPNNMQCSFIKLEGEATCPLLIPARIPAAA